MDNHATTRVDPRVVEAMLPYFTRRVWQRRQHHSCLWLGGQAGRGRSPRKAGGSDRGPVREIVFTSGATESNNLAIQGVAERYRNKATTRSAW